MNTSDWGASSLAASAFALSGFLLSLCIAMAMIAGCERTEPVIHVDTPGGEVEVDRNVDTGEVTMDVDDRTTNNEQDE